MVANLLYYSWFNEFIQVFVIVARASVVSVIIDPRPRFVFQYWINTTSERKLFDHVRSLNDEIKRRHRILAVTAARILSFCKLIQNRNVIKHWTLTLSRLTVITTDKNHYSVLGIHIDIIQTGDPIYLNYMIHLYTCIQYLYRLSPQCGVGAVRDMSTTMLTVTYYMVEWG